MTRYRQQLKRAQHTHRNAGLAAAIVRRRIVRPGELITGKAGEVLDVVATVEGTDVVISRVRLERDYAGAVPALSAEAIAAGATA